nr:MAG: hypothetical protein [Bacteriophage sp.]
MLLADDGVHHCVVLGVGERPAFLVSVLDVGLEAVSEVLHECLHLLLQGREVLEVELFLWVGIKERGRSCLCDALDGCIV